MFIHFLRSEHLLAVGKRCAHRLADGARLFARSSATTSAKKASTRSSIGFPRYVALRVRNGRSLSAAAHARQAATLRQRHPRVAMNARRPHDVPPPSGELNGIADKIDQDLRQATSVAMNGSQT
jgi:hypothetical protein